LKEPELCVEEKTTSSTNGAEKTGISTCRRLTLSMSLCTIINSKWMKDLNVRSETVKLLWEKKGIHWII
jgi:hypothetical protein